MRIKTFYAKNMTAALKEIRETLGPEALLLTSKELQSYDGASGHSAGVEVVAAVDLPEGYDVASSDFHKLSENQKQLPMACGFGKTAPDPDEMNNSITTTPAQTSVFPVSLSDELNVNDKADDASEPVIRSRTARKLYCDLMESGVDSSLAGRMVSQAVAILPAGKRRSRAALIDATARMIPGVAADDDVESDLPEKKVIAFVGPTGVGKTTSIAKLAVHLALGHNRKVMLLSMDDYRIGAIEQLRTYAGLMGIPFRFVRDVPELQRQIENNDRRDYLLIDTAGRSLRDMETMKPLAGFLRDAGDIERHLVLSASMKPSDMRRVEEQFEICEPDHLFFTKLDETSTPGPILNELDRTRKSFSYYTDGQRVPDDLHVAARERIIGLMLSLTGNTLQARE